MPRNRQAASQPPEARSGAWNRFSFTALRRNQPRGRLDLELPVSELRDKELLGFKPPKLTVLHYGSPNKQM